MVILLVFIFVVRILLIFPLVAMIVSPLPETKTISVIVPELKLRLSIDTFPPTSIFPLTFKFPVIETDCETVMSLLNCAAPINVLVPLTNKPKTGKGLLSTTLIKY